MVHKLIEESRLADGQILLLTINRPRVLNALNQRVIEELDSLLDNYREDDSVRGIILTGAGEKAFVAGADIAEMPTMSFDEAVHMTERGKGLLDKIDYYTKPVIAAVNGFALGGGLELAMACHMRVASENARFGLPEVKLGLMPGYGGTQRLPQLVGKGRALELMMTANMIGAQDAYRTGLVNHVVPLDEVVSKAVEILEACSKNSPNALKYVVRAVNAGYHHDVDGYAKESELFAKAIVSDDGREGTSAFVEKRKPSFSGN